MECIITSTLLYGCTVVLVLLAVANMYRNTYKQQEELPDDSSQTPLWDASTNYVADIPDIKEPLAKAKQMVQDKVKLHICMKAGICIKCGEPLTYEICFENTEDEPIDTSHPSCQKCMIRYKAELY